MNIIAVKKKFEGADDLDWSLSESELTGTLLNHESSALLFGVVEGETVLEELKELGAIKKLEARGYRDFRVDKRTRVQHGDRFLLWAVHDSDEKEYLLCDIRTRFAEIDWSGSKIKALFWEWLGFQDPKSAFAPDKPPLPGQDFPGLGVFRECTRMLRNHIGETNADVIAAVPEYFHNAWLYSRTFHFRDPKVEGQFRALVRDLMPQGLAATSHAIHDGRVVDEQGEVFQWKPHHQVFPLTPDTKAHFGTDEYQKMVQYSERTFRFFTKNSEEA